MKNTMTETKSEDRFGVEYSQHQVFEKLKYYANFYDLLSFLIMGNCTMGIKEITNLDTFSFSSIKGTIESINEVLSNGRINDAYALLRKYYDSTIINIYVNLFLSDNVSIDNFVVEEIEKWRTETETKIQPDHKPKPKAKSKTEIIMPKYGIISDYIKKSNKLVAINKLLNNRKNSYRKIRTRCNDNVHYNFYFNFLLNDNEIHNPDRLEWLNRFSEDIEALFIQHFAYIFYLNDHYMMASNHIDCLDMGMQPKKDSEYWVADFIQDVFDKVIKAKRKDIATAILANTKMQLK